MSQRYKNAVLPGEHLYVNQSEARCREGVNGCTVAALTKAIHQRGAYPGQKSPLKANGGYQYREIDSLYGDWWSSDSIYSLPTATGVVNVTNPDHALHPGFVIRDVIRIDGYLHIQTTGGGWGKFGIINNSRASELWGEVDGRVLKPFQ